jgi:hypothetical protein
MKPGLLLQHIGIALVLTGIATLNEALFRQFFSALVSVKFTMVCALFLYLTYLIWQSRQPTGRITLFIINVGVLLIGQFAVTQLSNLILIYLVLIWLNRCLLCYASLFSMIVDLGLCLISLTTVYFIFITGNHWLTALWCFFLLQALHTLIPGKKINHNLDHAATNENFNLALQSAESALQQILRKI